jgi:light-regulated signal transduction histidine kinase (bacteriophytochrome)
MNGTWRTAVGCSSTSTARRDGGTVVLHTDVTALKDREAALERSNRELQDFAYVASHDLQEPLRKIEAFGDRLKAKCCRSWMAMASST